MACMDDGMVMAENFEPAEISDRLRVLLVDWMVPRTLQRTVLAAQTVTPPHVSLF